MALRATIRPIVATLHQLPTVCRRLAGGRAGWSPEFGPGLSSPQNGGSTCPSRTDAVALWLHELVFSEASVHVSAAQPLPVLARCPLYLSLSLSLFLSLCRWSSSPAICVGVVRNWLALAHVGVVTLDLSGMTCCWL